MYRKCWFEYNGRLHGGVVVPEAESDFHSVRSHFRPGDMAYDASRRGFLVRSPVFETPEEARAYTRSSFVR